MSAPAPGLRFVDCRCGHPRSPDHDRPGFELQCTAKSCTCVQYRPKMDQAAPRPVLAHTLARPPVDPDIAVRGERGPTIEQVLAAGKRSGIKRTVALTEKIALQLHDLRGRLTDERQTAEAKRKRDEDQAAARTEVERLKAELAAAQARLTGRTPPAAKSVAPRGPREPGEYGCPDCPETFTSPQGRGAHRARKHGYRREAG